MLPQPLQLRILLPNALPADSQKQQDQLTRFITCQNMPFSQHFITKGLSQMFYNRLFFSQINEEDMLRESWLGAVVLLVIFCGE